ncbi:hypothetical protein EVAR_24210_1 [Eumeta japonica]|uniref:Uncharacterized protein n=1 Tax=Eumeta variegata TaxID=151549 RepID=A0A4C1W7E1_EUMVA|nr:hypothetical protein EVAR_24210_1 [Eumeta japonica]
MGAGAARALPVRFIFELQFPARLGRPGVRGRRVSSSLIFLSHARLVTCGDRTPFRFSSTKGKESYGNTYTGSGRVPSRPIRVCFDVREIRIPLYLFLSATRSSAGREPRPGARSATYRSALLLVRTLCFWTEVSYRKLGKGTLFDLTNERAQCRVGP